MVVDEPEDKVPTNFIIKVYETKALAETGNAADALFVFENGIDAGADNTDPRVSKIIDGFVKEPAVATRKKPSRAASTG